MTLPDHNICPLLFGVQVPAIGSKEYESSYLYTTGEGGREGDLQMSKPYLVFRQWIRAEKYPKGYFLWQHCLAR